MHGYCIDSANNRAAGRGTTSAGSIRRLLDGMPTGGGALLLQGEPGSGRTALVGYAHRHARGLHRARRGRARRGGRPAVRRTATTARPGARPGRARCPIEQRRLLRRALAGEGCPADQRLALSMAVLGLLAAAARDRPLLATMDDVDLGDRQTAEVLAFVARRLRPPAGRRPAHRRT